jgi:CheY-like chemotaxis protein
MSTILLVEDNIEDARTVQRVLKLAGVTNDLILVHDGDEAIAYLEGSAPYEDRTNFPLPQVIFLDLKLPRVDGFEVLDWIRHHPDIRAHLLTVVLSGFDQIREINRAYALGAHSFLVKPCSRADVQNLTEVFTGYWDRSAAHSPAHSTA